MKLNDSQIATLENACHVALGAFRESEAAMKAEADKAETPHARTAWQRVADQFARQIRETSELLEALGETEDAPARLIESCGYPGCSMCDSDNG